MAAILASQLFAVPATAGNITVGTGGQVVVGSKSQHVHNRNNIRIHRHYYSPKVYTRKVYQAKPVPKNAPYVQQKLKNKSYRYLYAPRYGSKRQHYHRKSFGQGY
ncbi:hypothetical protein DS906_09270 [Ruegeria sp. A3M17]|nr:hypothetical protein DS906_09270 [Ruegeria sp. A3M17]